MQAARSDENRLGFMAAFSNAALRTIAAFSLIATIAGCTQSLPVIHSGPDPADGKSAVMPTAYKSVTAGTANYQPVEPKSWREMNERVAPRAGQSP